MIVRTVCTEWKCNFIHSFVFLSFLGGRGRGGGGGSESTITGATTGLLHQLRMMTVNDDKCGAVGGMLGRGNQSTWIKPARVTVSTTNLT
jgi:hypothetical protein